MKRSGVRSLSAIDLTTMVLTREPRDLDRNVAAATGLAERGLPAMLDLSPADLSQASGLEGFEADRLLAAIELGRKAAKAGEAAEPIDITSALSAYRFFHSRIGGLKQEVFAAAFLNAKNEMISFRELHRGTLTMSVVGLRELFREAVRENAAQVVVAHNHPSGDPEPSPEDWQITAKIVEAGKLLDIPLLDHIVVGEARGDLPGFVSLRARGAIKDA